MSSLNRLLLLMACCLPNTLWGQSGFRVSTFRGSAGNEPLTIHITRVESGRLQGTMTDSQGTYPFTAKTLGDSIPDGEADLQAARLKFTGKLADKSSLRINFLAPDGSGQTVSVLLRALSETTTNSPTSGTASRDPKLVGAWGQTISETSGWGESLSMLAYEQVEVFYADGSCGSGKGELRTMDANYQAYDDQIKIERLPEVRWSTNGDAILLDVATAEGPKQFQGTYRIVGDKLQITWSDGRQLELTRRK